MIENALYRLRFTEEELRQQRDFWRPICNFLQQYIDRQGATLDIGAGYCHFINQIESRRRVALDINEETVRKYAQSDIEIVVSDAADLSELAPDSFDSIFASNVYEHFQSKEDVARNFSQAYRILKPGGRIVVLQPNFAYCAKQYFDFFDHRLIFTHRSMAEGLEAAGFTIERLIPRFLPFTSKSRLPRAAWMVSLYVKIPPVWKIFGAQMLVVGSKRPPPNTALKRSPTA
jgi:SAM-dependent methyltransferase